MLWEKKRADRRKAYYDILKRQLADQKSYIETKRADPCALAPDTIAGPLPKSPKYPFDSPIRTAHLVGQSSATALYMKSSFQKGIDFYFANLALDLVSATPFDWLSFFKGQHEGVAPTGIEPVSKV